MMKNVEPVYLIKMQTKPNNGLYHSPELYKTLLELKRRIDNFIPDHIVSGSIAGTKPQMIGNAKAIVLQSKILVEIVKGIIND